MRILYKVSGDLTGRSEVLEDIKAAAKANHVAVIYGLGTQLNGVLRQRNIPFRFVDGVRETTDEGLEVALEICDECRSRLELEFCNHCIDLIAPVQVIDGKIVNTNADEIVLKEKDRYDEIIVYTIDSRDKKRLAKQLGDKIQIKRMPISPSPSLP